MIHRWQTPARGPNMMTKSLLELLARRYYAAHAPLTLKIPECSDQSVQGVHWRLLLRLNWLSMLCLLYCEIRSWIDFNLPVVLLGLPFHFRRASRWGFPVLHWESVRRTSATVPGGRCQTGHLVIGVTGSSTKPLNLFKLCTEKSTNQLKSHW